MSHAPNDFALVIGIGHYPSWPGKRKTLPGATKDAAAFARWLRAGDGGGLPRDHVRLLPSREKPLSPLQDKIDAELKWIADAIESKALRPRRFYFYFAGHGHIWIGQKGDAPSLCLPNWSLKSPSAALDSESYLNTAVGCMGFREGFFFLDCCRVSQAAPVGRGSYHECISPELEGRYFGVAHAAEKYKAGYEGPIDGELRGYFTSALLEILAAGPISLFDLKGKLEEKVPLVSEGKQVPRFPIDIPNEQMRAILFGNAAAVKKPSKPPGKLDAPLFKLTIKTNTNLSTAPRGGEDTPPPTPGHISLYSMRGDRLAQGWGSLNSRQPRGKYRILVEHGDGVLQKEFVLRKESVVTLELPRRRSAAPLSSTFDKHENVTDPAVSESSWSPEAGDQAIFLLLRTRSDILKKPLPGRLSLVAPNGDRDGGLWGASMLRKAMPGTWLLHYIHRGPPITLPLPVVQGWDTQVFIMVDEGEPQIDRATILMRRAGLGFDPSDALLDAYERALGDLATGGEGPDDMTLSNLLLGKYHNPLFGIVGAHFLLRRLAKNPKDEKLQKDCEIVLKNLAELIGREAPDMKALHLMLAGALGKSIPDAIRFDAPPLMRAGLLAAVNATAERPEILPYWTNGTSLIASSPWACVQVLRSYWGLSWSRYGDPEVQCIRFENLSPEKYQLARFVLEEKGFEFEEAQGTAVLEAVMRGAANADASYKAYSRLPSILDIPEWLVGLLKDEISRAEKVGRQLNYADLVRRTENPRSTIEDAALVARFQLRASTRQAV